LDRIYAVLNPCDLPRANTMSKPNGAHLSNYEIRREGWKVLTERLGVSGAIRFLTQYDAGFGDYTKERRDMFADLTLDEALRRIEDRATPQQ
jgi:hypothetical protein